MLRRPSGWARTSVNTTGRSVLSMIRGVGLQEHGPRGNVWTVPGRELELKGRGRWLTTDDEMAAF